MLRFKNLFLRPELVDHSSICKRECLFPSKLTWRALYLPSYLNAVDLGRTKNLHFQVQIGQKGFSDKALSSEVLEPMDSNTIVKENSHSSDLPSTYDNAMEELSSLITSKRRGDGSSISDKYTKLERMSMYIKGSTCAFCVSILRECGLKTGLFTSPHLIDVRERFRLDGLDISKEKFLNYFWECWHQLKKNVTDDLPMPSLFQFLTVLAFKIFTCEKVEVAIVEVGLGGTRDSINVIKNPPVCGVSSLGMDHMETLGDTLPEIASHKAGIFKPQVPAFTVPQLSEAMDVLQETASKLTVPLEVVGALDRTKLKGNQLSFSSDHQFTNAGLAVSLCKSWLQRTGNWEKFFKHILLFNCMDVRDPQILLPTLVDTCASSGTHFSKAIFVPSISTYSKVTSADSAIPLEIPSKNLTWQFKLQSVWEKIIHGKDAECKSFQMGTPDSTPPRRFINEDASSCSPADGQFACSSVVSSLPMTINWLRNYVKDNPSFRIQVLVTGSLHLVGDALKLLRR